MHVLITSLAMIGAALYVFLLLPAILSAAKKKKDKKKE